MKKSLLILLAMAFALGIMLAGCGETSSLGLTGDNDGTVVIEAENANMDDYVIGGSVVADKEGKIHVDFDFTEDSEVKINLIKQSEDQSIDMSEEEIQELVSTDNSVLEDTLAGTGTADYFLATPGEYDVLARIVSEKCTGTATISGK